MTRISINRLSKVTPRLKTILCDISGILHQDETLIHPSHTEMMHQLQKRFQIQFITNTAKRTPESIVKMLSELGYRNLSEDQILTSLSFTKKRLQDMNFRNPCVILDERVEKWFLDGIEDQWEKNSDHDAIVIASNPRLLTESEISYLVEIAQEYMARRAAENGSSSNNNDANSKIPLIMSNPLKGVTLSPLMQNLTKTLEQKATPAQQHQEPSQSTQHQFRELLQYTQEELVCGKPNREIFLHACKRTECKPSEALMMGDSIDSDIIGALQTDIPAILVRTGKYQASDEELIRLCQDDDHLVGVEDDFGEAARTILECV